MSQNLVAVIWYVIGMIVIIGPFVLLGRIFARRDERREFEAKQIQQKQIYEMNEVMRQAQYLNLHEAGEMLSNAGLVITDDKKVKIPEIFWKTNIRYMARTIITCVKFHISNHGLDEESLNDTMAVFIYCQVADCIKEFGKINFDKALSLVVELATRDKRAAKGLNYCFLGNYADEIYR